MQTLHVELVQQILLLMPYRDCLQLAKTSKRFYSIFTSCYYHSAKIEDIGHWMKLLMTGYIPQALRVPSYIYVRKGISTLKVEDGVLTILDICKKHLTAVPASIRNLMHLEALFFDVMQAFRK